MAKAQLSIAVETATARVNIENLKKALESFGQDGSEAFKALATSTRAFTTKLDKRIEAQGKLEELDRTHLQQANARVQTLKSTIPYQKEENRLLAQKARSLEKATAGSVAAMAREGLAGASPEAVREGRDRTLAEHGRLQAQRRQDAIAQIKDTELREAKLKEIEQRGLAERAVIRNKFRTAETREENRILREDERRARKRKKWLSQIHRSQKRRFAERIRLATEMNASVNARRKHDMKVEAAHEAAKDQNYNRDRDRAIERAQVQKDHAEANEIQRKQIHAANEEAIDVTRRRIATDKDLEDVDKRNIDVTRKRLIEGEKLSAAERRLIRQLKIKIAANRKLSASEQQLAAAIARTTTAIKINRSWMGKMILSTGSLRRQLASLRNAFLVWAFSIAFVVAPLVNALRKAAELEKGMKALDIVGQRLGISFIALRSAATSLTKDGLLNIAQVSLSLSRLLATGIGLPKATELLAAFKNAAVFGGQGTRTLNENLIVAIDGFRNFQSRALDNIGITKNASVIIAEYGRSVGKSAREMSELEKHLALANGLIKEARLFDGSAELAARTLTGQMERLTNAWALFNAAFGQMIGGRSIVASMADSFFSLADAMQSWSNSDPEKVLTWMENVGGEAFSAKAKIISFRLELEQMLQDTLRLPDDPGAFGLNALGTYWDLISGKHHQALAELQNYQEALGAIPRDQLTLMSVTGVDPELIKQELTRVLQGRRAALQADIAESQKEARRLVALSQSAENREAILARERNRRKAQNLGAGQPLPIAEITPAEAQALFDAADVKITERMTHAQGLLEEQLKKTNAGLVRITGRSAEVSNAEAEATARLKERVPQIERNIQLAKNFLRDKKDEVRVARELVEANVEEFKIANKTEAQKEAFVRSQVDLLSRVVRGQEGVQSGILQAHRNLRAAEQSNLEFRVKIGESDENVMHARRQMNTDLAHDIKSTEQQLAEDILNIRSVMMDKEDKQSEDRIQREAARDNEALQASRQRLTLGLRDQVKSASDAGVDPAAHAVIRNNIEELRTQSLQSIEDEYKAKKGRARIQYEDDVAYILELGRLGIQEDQRRREANANANSALDRADTVREKNEKDDADARSKAIDAELAGWLKIKAARKTLAKLRGEQVEEEEGMAEAVEAYSRKLEAAGVSTEKIAIMTAMIKKLWQDIAIDRDLLGKEEQAEKMARAWISAMNSVSRAADSTGNKMVAKYARVAAQLIDVANKIRAVQEASKDTGTLGTVAGIVQIGANITSIIAGDRQKDRARKGRGMSVGGTISRGPQTVNINPTLVNTVDNGMIVFSADGAEAFKHSVMDMVAESIDRGELSGLTSLN